MKRISLLLIIPCFIACDREIPREENHVDKSNTTYFEEITEFKYKGHEYIKFQKLRGKKSSSCGVVHNPDCKKCTDVYD